MLRATMLKTTLKRPRRLEQRQGLFSLMGLIAGFMEEGRTCIRM